MFPIKSPGKAGGKQEKEETEPSPVPVDLLFVRLALVRKRDLVSGFLVPVRTRLAVLVPVRMSILLMDVLADRLATLVMGALGRLGLLGFSGLLERLVRLLQVVEELAGFLCV